MKPPIGGPVEGDEASAEEPLRTAETGRSSGTFRVRVQVPSAPARFELQPRVLVALPENSARVELVRTLRGSGLMDVVEFDLSRADRTESVPPQELDVALLHASCLDLNCAALVHDANFGFPELVFAFDDRCYAQRLALLSRGYRHVVSAACLTAWLHERLTSLCALARARRIVLAACSTNASMPVLTLDAVGTGSMNLHLAETYFRDTFLRALLAEYGSRRKAAEVAGVPYRSFCEMLRKLGI